MVNSHNHLYETPDLPGEIKEAAMDGSLVLFVGAGLSMQVGLPSWGELADYALNDLLHKKIINHSDREQLKSLSDPKKKLSVAKILAVNSGGHIDLVKPLSVSPPDGEGIYKYVNDIGCSCVTTNYDKLLKPRYKDSASTEGDVTFSDASRVIEIDENLYVRLCNPGTVIHIHGSIDDDASMVVTTSDYLEHYDKPHLKHFLGELFEKKVILFIGYGLEEAEILEHILRRGGVRGNGGDVRRFVLQGYFRSNEPLYQNLCDYYLQSFGVQLIGYSMDQHGYGQLEEVLRRWSEEIEVRPQALVDALQLMDEVL